MSDSSDFEQEDYYQDDDDFEASSNVSSFMSGEPLENAWTRRSTRRDPQDDLVQLDLYAGRESVVPQSNFRRLPGEMPTQRTPPQGFPQGNGPVRHSPPGGPRRNDETLVGNDPDLVVQNAAAGVSELINGYESGSAGALHRDRAVRSQREDRTPLSSARVVEDRGSRRSRMGQTTGYVRSQVSRENSGTPVNSTTVDGFQAMPPNSNGLAQGNEKNKSQKKQRSRSVDLGKQQESQANQRQDQGTGQPQSFATEWLGDPIPPPQHEPFQLGATAATYGPQIDQNGQPNPLFVDGTNEGAPLLPPPPQSNENETFGPPHNGHGESYIPPAGKDQGRPEAQRKEQAPRQSQVPPAASNAPRGKQTMEAGFDLLKKVGNGLKYKELENPRQVQVVLQLLDSVEVDEKLVEIFQYARTGLQEALVRSGWWSETPVFRDELERLDWKWNQNLMLSMLDEFEALSLAGKREPPKQPNKERIPLQELNHTRSTNRGGFVVYEDTPERIGGHETVNHRQNTERTRQQDTHSNLRQVNIENDYERVTQSQRQGASRSQAGVALPRSFGTRPTSQSDHRNFSGFPSGRREQSANTARDQRDLPPYNSQSHAEREEWAGDPGDYFEGFPRGENYRNRGFQSDRPYGTNTGEPRNRHTRFEDGVGETQGGTRYQNQGFRSTVNNNFRLHATYPWPEGWEVDVDSCSSLPFKELKAFPFNFGGSPTNYPRFRTFFKTNVHQNSKISTSQRTSLLSDMLPEGIRDLIGATITESNEEYSDMLACLDSYFSEELLEAYSEAFDACPSLDKSKPGTYTKLIGLLKTASRDLKHEDTKHLVSKVLRRLGDLKTVYNNKYVRRNQNLRNLSEFLAQEYFLQFMRTETKTLEPRQRRPQAQAPRAFFTEPEEPDTEEFSEYSCSEEAELTLLARNNPSRKPVAWKDKWDPCPICPGKEKHFLVTCPRFIRTPDVKERWKIVKELNRCTRCLSPLHLLPNCSWEGGCEICRDPSHHTQLHRFPGEGDNTYLCQIDNEVSLVVRPGENRCMKGANRVTIRLGVVILRNPVTGQSTRVNCAVDSCASLTQCHIGVSKRLGLQPGPGIEIKEKGVGGISFSTNGHLADVTIEAVDKSVSVTYPIRFCEKSPTGDCKMIDWNLHKDRFDILKDLQIPKPAEVPEGGPEVELILGNDLPMLQKYNFDEGHPERGGLHPMTPFAQKLRIGWVIGGYTGETPPDRRDVVNGRVLLQDSVVVLCPDSRMVLHDPNKGINVYTPLKSKEMEKKEWFFGPAGRVNCPAIPGDHEEDQVAFLLDGFAEHLAERADHAVDPIREISPEKLWELDAFSQDSCPLTSEHLRARKAFESSFQQIPETGQCQVAVLWKPNEPNLPNNYSSAVRIYERREDRMVKKNQEDKGKDFYDGAFSELADLGIIQELPDDAQSREGFFIDTFIVSQPRKLTTPHRMVFNAKGQFWHLQAKKSFNDAVCDCPDVMTPLLAVLLRMRRHPVLLGGDIKKMFLRVLVPEEDRVFMKFVWRKGCSKSEPLKVFSFTSHFFGKKDSPFVAMSTIIHQIDRHGDQYPLFQQVSRESMLVDDVLASVETEEEALELKDQAVEFLDRFCSMKVRKFVTNSDRVREAIPETERAPTISIEGIDPSASHLVRTLGIIYSAQVDCFTYQFDLSLPEIWTKRTTLGLLSRIYDPDGHITPFVVYGRILFQRLCLALPDHDWDTPVDGALLKDFKNWVQNADMLCNIRIPRCLRRHAHESSEFEVDHPYFQAEKSGECLLEQRESIGMKGACSSSPQVQGEPQAGCVNCPEQSGSPDLLDRAEVIDKRFVVLSQEFHIFVDASSAAYGMVMYCLTNYLQGRPTVRQVFAKGRIAPKKPPTIPRLELCSCLLGAEIASEVARVYGFDRKDPNSPRFTFWSDSQVALFWIRSSRPKRMFVENRVKKILVLTEEGEWRFCPGPWNPADHASRGLTTMDEQDSQWKRWIVWIHGPFFLYGRPEEYPENITVTPSPEAEKEMQREQAYSFFVTPQVDWKFDEGSSPKWHPGRFHSLEKLVSFLQVFKTFTKRLREYVARIRTEGPAERELMKEHLIKVEQVLSQKKEAREANMVRSVQFYRSLLIKKQNPKFSKVPEPFDLEVHYSSSFQQVRTSLILQAQQDVHQEDITQLRRKQPVHKDSTLAHQRPLLDEGGILKVRGRFAANDSVHCVTVLPKGHPITRLLVKHVHEQSLRHVGSTLRLIGEVKKSYWVPQMKTLVESILSSCHHCRIRFPRPFKQEMAPIHRTRLPGESGKTSPFAFAEATAVDFMGPISTRQGRGKPRQDRWVAVFCCQTTRSLFLHPVQSTKTSDCLVAFLTFFLRQTVPLIIISDGGKNLKRTDVELKELHESVKKLQPLLDKELTDWPAITWKFTAPFTPSQNGAVERYMSTIKRAMKAMSQRNPFRDLTDDELTFLLVRVESVMNLKPLCTFGAETDEEQAITPAHFSGRGNCPLRLNVPEEVRSSSGNQHRLKWFKIEEAVESFWQQWWVEYGQAIRRVPKWTRGEAKLEVGDLVVVLDDEEFRTSLKWPVALVLGLEKDQDGRIQTVRLKFRKAETKRGIRQLAPLPTHGV